MLGLWLIDLLEHHKIDPMLSVSIHNNVSIWADWSVYVVVFTDIVYQVCIKRIGACFGVSMRVKGNKMEFNPPALTTLTHQYSNYSWFKHILFRYRVHRKGLGAA